MSLIEHILNHFGYFKTKEEKQEEPKAVSNVIWGVGFNLTQEQMKKCKFKPFYQIIPELTVESMGGVPNVGEYLTFKYTLGTDKNGLEDFLFVRIKIRRVEMVLGGKISSFYVDICGDVVTIHDRGYAKLLDLENYE